MLKCLHSLTLVSLPSVSVSHSSLNSAWFTFAWSLQGLVQHCTINWIPSGSRTTKSIHAQCDFYCLNPFLKETSWGKHSWVSTWKTRGHSKQRKPKMQLADISPSDCVREEKLHFVFWIEQLHSGICVHFSVWDRHSNVTSLTIMLIHITHLTLPSYTITVLDGPKSTCALC